MTATAQEVATVATTDAPKAPTIGGYARCGCPRYLTHFTGEGEALRTVPHFVTQHNKGTCRGLDPRSRGALSADDAIEGSDA